MRSTCPRRGANRALPSSGGVSGAPVAASLRGERCRGLQDRWRRSAPDRKASSLAEPSAPTAARCHHDTSYCSRCDLLVGLDDSHVTASSRIGTLVERRSRSTLLVYLPRLEA